MKASDKNLRNSEKFKLKITLTVTVKFPPVYHKN